MTFARATFRKDFVRILRDPVALLFWLGIPLLIGGLMTLLFGGREGPKPQAHVLVADLDGSFLSGLLVGALTQEAAGGFVRAEAVEEAEGRERIGEGDGTAFLVIPEGFGQAVLDDTPTSLELVKNPSQQILPGIVEEGLTIVVDGAFYAQRLLGDQLRPMFDEVDLDASPTDLFVSDVSVRINGIVERLEGTLFPPVLELELEAPPEVVAARQAAADSAAAAEGRDPDAAADGEGESGGASGVAFLFLPALLFMSLLFMAQGFASDVWVEREGRTLRRVVTSPRRVEEFLLGKTLAGVVFVALIAGIALLVGYAYFGLDWRTYPAAVAWSALSGAMLIELLMVIKLHAANARVSDVLSMVVVFPLMMLGGSFFPFEAMPDRMAAIGRLTPNGWALTRLKEILAGDLEAAPLALAAAALLGITALLFFWAARRLGGSFARGA